MVSGLARLSKFFGFLRFSSPPSHKNAPGGPKGPPQTLNSAPQTLNSGPRTLGEIWQKMQKTKKLTFCGPRKPGQDSVFVLIIVFISNNVCLTISNTVFGYSVFVFIIVFISNNVCSTESNTVFG